MHPVYLSLILITLLVSCKNNQQQQPGSGERIESIDSSHYDTNSIKNDSPLPEARIDTPSVEKHWLEGEHLFTLHWIGWDRPGRVQIGPEVNGWHTISGSQKGQSGNFIAIEGKLQPVSKKELKFRGSILTQVETINGGDTCSREKEQTFLSTKNRKYWRMQDMENCEGGGLVDYIDIYF